MLGLLWGTLFSALALAIYLHFKKRSISNGEDEEIVTGAGDPILYAQFIKFKRSYLLVYLLVTTGDWLQGPYLYTIFTVHGYSTVQISAFYFVSFFSALIAGTLVGSQGDKHGRKLMAMLCCAFVSASCLFILTNNYWLHIFGRFCGGVGTSLMYSAFEAWMVSEHNRLGFPEQWCSETFGQASFGNGIAAILSGLLASVLARWGPGMPFVAAMLANVAAAAVIFRTWCLPHRLHPEASALTSHKGGITGAIALCRQDSTVATVGLVLALFEGAMNVFIFLWTPALAPTYELLPFGLIFAAFMATAMAGSAGFSYATAVHMASLERLAVVLFGAAAAALTGAAVALGVRPLVFFMFCAFEFCVGSFWPMSGTMRSRVIPENIRPVDIPSSAPPSIASSVMLHLFRVPLNIIVLVAMALSSALSTRAMLLYCVLVLLCAAVLQYRVIRQQQSHAAAASAALVEPIGSTPSVKTVALV